MSCRVVALPSGQEKASHAGNADQTPSLLHVISFDAPLSMLKPLAQLTGHVGLDAGSAAPHEAPALVVIGLTLTGGHHAGQVVGRASYVPSVWHSIELGSGCCCEYAQVSWHAAFVAYVCPSTPATRS